MLSLPVITWVRFLVWLDIGLLIYWFYGRSHSPLADRAEATRRTPLQKLANFITIIGLLLIFNAACITILAYMTEFGVTSETLAKWSELSSLGFNVTAEEADAFGLRFLVVAIAVWAVGFGLTKASGEK
jgi:hypothetical protein